MASPATPCTTVNLASFLPSCAALSSVAGVRTFFYGVRLADLNLTFGTDGGITAIALKTGGKLVKIDGQKFQNSGAFELAASTIGKIRFKHTWNFRAFFREQASRNIVRSLALVQDLVVIAPNNDNQIEVYGATVGLTATSLKGSTGIKLDDDNTALFAFEGEEPALPAIFSTVTGATTTDAQDFTTNLAVLDALVTS